MLLKASLNVQPQSLHLQARIPLGWILVVYLAVVYYLVVSPETTPLVTRNTDQICSARCGATKSIKS